MIDQISVSPARRPREQVAGASKDFNQALLAAIPKLRSFAISLCGNADYANDLVQQTAVRAWANRKSFEAGTNMPAWLHRILRNEFYSDFRRRCREIPDSDGAFAAGLVSHPTQDFHIEFLDFREAFHELDDDHREVLELIAASDLSYEEAAHCCGCAVGTIKRRVHRARIKLSQLIASGAGKARRDGVSPAFALR